MRKRHLSLLNLGLLLVPILALSAQTGLFKLVQTISMPNV